MSKPTSRLKRYSLQEVEALRHPPELLLADQYTPADRAQRRRTEHKTATERRLLGVVLMVFVALLCLWVWGASGQSQ